MKRLVKPLILAVLIILVFGSIFYTERYELLRFSINPKAVASIEVSSGSTGKIYSIADRAQINHIVGNLNSITFKKGRSAKHTVGFSLDVTMLDKNGKCISGCIINAPGSIAYKDYFYSDSTESVDHRYIIDLISKMKPYKEL